MTASEIRQESLSRAVQGQSLANYPAIIEGFMQKGIPEAEINPRENVFTFNAWKALGRSVKKGEHGVKVFTFAESTTKDELTGKELRIERMSEQAALHPSQQAEWFVAWRTALAVEVWHSVRRSDELQRIFRSFRN